MIEQFYDLSRPLLDADERALALCREQFARLEEIKEYNQLKMLKAFTDCRVGGSHLVGTTGYGMDDAGRGKLEEVFAVLTGSEAALFRHNFMSGTHTLSVALFGVLRPGDRMVAVTGRPYDTLAGVIGIDGTHYGNLMEFGVQYDEVDLLADGTPDLAGIARKCRGAKMCYIQRSRGYAARPALSLEQIEAVSRAAKAVQPDIIVMVDNCYGEFTQKQEPTQRGADLMAGSLIKNPGGGIAPTGGYIAGRADLVELCAHRLSAPGVGGEIGCTLDMLRGMYLGLYYAPGVVCEALKTSVYAACLFELLGYAATPAYGAAERHYHQCGDGQPGGYGGAVRRRAGGQPCGQLCSARTGGHARLRGSRHHGGGRIYHGQQHRAFRRRPAARAVYRVYAGRPEFCRRPRGRAAGRGPHAASAAL